METICIYAGFVVGFLAFFLVLSIIAILRARKGKPWIWFSIGCLGTLVPLFNASSNRSYSGDLITILWSSFVVLAIIVICIIRSRKRKSKK